MAATIDNLPPELIDAILDLVGAVDRVVCAHVSRLWRAVAMDKVARRQSQGPSDKIGFIAGAVRAGRWHLVEWARGQGCPWTDEATVAALDSGRGDLFARLVALGCPVQHGACAVAAAAKGDLTSLLHVIETGRLARPEGSDALWAAAGAGQIDALSLLCARDYGCEASECWTAYTKVRHRLDSPLGPASCACAHYAGHAAARGGHIETLAWLRDHGCRFDDLVMPSAAEGGHIDAMAWLRDNGAELTSEACYWAAEAGQLDALRWLRANGCPWDKCTCLHAAYEGHLEILQWAMAGGCPCDPLATTFAVIGGHLDVAEWTLKQGCALVTEHVDDIMDHPSFLAHMMYRDTVMDIVARGGRIDVLEWLCAHGCRAEVTTFVAAARRGRMCVLDWLHEHCRPWDEEVCAEIASAGSLGALAHLRARGCPWDERTCVGAARNGCLDVLKWATANGCPWNKDTICYEARLSRGPAMLQWLVAQGCAWDDRIAMCAASATYEPDLLAWIVTSGRPWDAEACLDRAQRAGRRRVVAWIEAYRAAAAAAQPLRPPEPAH